MTDDAPGLVVTLLNIHKPRDRSHYERFRHFHETFYRSVEVGERDAVLRPRARPWLRRRARRAGASPRAPSSTPPRGRRADRGRPRRSSSSGCSSFRLARATHSRSTTSTSAPSALASVQSRIVDLLDSWQQDLRRLPRTMASPLQYQKLRGWTSRSRCCARCSTRLRVRAPPQVPRQPLAARRRAEREPVPEGPDRRLGAEVDE